MSFSVGGIPVQGIVVQSIQAGKSRAEEVVKQMITEVMNDPGKNLRDMQNPSGLSSFLDLKV